MSALQKLALLPEHGPGSAWVRSAERGDERHLLGPRRSMELHDLEDACILFGDETSFGLAAAAQDSLGGIRTLHHVFEVESRAEAMTVLAAVGIRHPTSSSVVRTTSISGRSRRRSCAWPARPCRSCCPATPGRSSISSARSRHVGSSRSGYRRKPIWAPGKIGMD